MGEALVAKSPHDLVSRGIAPVLSEYLQPLVPRQQVDAVASTQVELTGQAPTKKSKNQKRKERQEEKKSGLCTNFALGQCQYGNGCRFSHDLDAYLASKPKDLPGRCPFTLAEKCPFGITCRWYKSHTVPGDPVCPLGIGKVEKGVSVSLGHPDDQGPCTHKIILDPVPSPTSSPQEVLVPTSLPLHSPGGPPRNVLTKDLQTRLWKKTYDFSRADDVLALLNIKNNAKDRGRGGGGQGAKETQNGKDMSLTRNGDADLDPVPMAVLSTSLSVPNAKRIKTEMGQRAPDEACSSPCGLSHPDENHDYVEGPLRPAERRVVDFRDKLYLAPLTTVGNLPFRRLCKSLGADITCGEMALATNLLAGQPSEWALLKRHPSEDCFGVQVCGGYADSLARCAQLLQDQLVAHGGIDFVDINMGCPIDLVCDRGAGSSLLLKPRRIEELCRSVSPLLSCPLTVKMRKGYLDHQDVAHTLMEGVHQWGASAVTLHGRSRQQRYSRQADWQYIEKCAALAPSGLQVIGNGDVMSWEHWEQHLRRGAQEEEEEEGRSPVTTCMIARGALVKPWIFTEIKERRHWDISAGERLDLLRDFCSYGLQHWGSDQRGVENTRRFLLEWMSYTCRYIPVGLLEVVPQCLHWRPPSYRGRSDLETWLASDSAQDWVKMSEMLLGPVPPNFSFTPKHKSSAYVPLTGAVAATPQQPADEEGEENG